MATSAFGTRFGTRMAVARFLDDAWQQPQVVATESLSLHPGSHALHYGSACFEGLKAHRGVDGNVRIFRLDAHVDRLRRSAEGVCLPAPPASTLADMIVSTVAANLDEVPGAPGSLYLRPTLIGTDANIGAAATPSSSALLYVLASPVGEYFSGELKLVLETRQPRTTPHFGRIKTGANYVMALPLLQDARGKHGADQVLFAPDGQVEETGAANVLLIDERRVVTPPLSDRFLHGVTRDSVLRISEDLGYEVVERGIDATQLMGWMPAGEIALAGTAAVLAPVGQLLWPDEEATASAGGHDHTYSIRDHLRRVQQGAAVDRHGWSTIVEP